MSKKKMDDTITGAVPTGTKKILSFDQFVMEQLRKGDRVKEVTKNVVEDFRVAIAKMATVQDPIWDRMPEFLSEIHWKYDNGGSPINTKSITQEQIDNDKDSLIVKVFIMELMRQYNNFLKNVD